MENERKMKVLINHIRKYFKDLFIKQLTQEELLDYWKNPTDKNTPGRYLTQNHRSLYLVELVNMVDKEFLPQDKKISILELGCNVGRNLSHLKNAVCCKLSGIEINPKSIKRGLEEYPILIDTIFYIGNVETEIRKIPQQDLIFSMAVLQHIHKSKIKKLCKDISDKTDIIILIENETYKSERHNKNNYKKIFEKLGYKETYYNFCMSKYGFIQRGFVTRILKKRERK